MLAGLHPDHNSFAQAQQAFELFKGLETVLVKSEEQPISDAPPLPKSIAEMMEAKRQAAEARRKR